MCSHDRCRFSAHDVAMQERGSGGQETAMGLVRVLNCSIVSNVSLREKRDDPIR